MYGLLNKSREAHRGPDENRNQKVNKMISQQIDQWIQDDWTFEISDLAVRLMSPCGKFRICLMPLDDEGRVLEFDLEAGGIRGLVTAGWLRHALTRAIDIAKAERNLDDNLIEV